MCKRMSKDPNIQRPEIAEGCCIKEQRSDQGCWKESNGLEVPVAKGEKDFKKEGMIIWVKYY